MRQAIICAIATSMIIMTVTASPLLQASLLDAKMTASHQLFEIATEELAAKRAVTCATMKDTEKGTEHVKNAAAGQGINSKDFINMALLCSVVSSRLGGYPIDTTTSLDRFATILAKGDTYEKKDLCEVCRESIYTFVIENGYTC